MLDEVSAGYQVMGGRLAAGRRAGIYPNIAYYFCTGSAGSLKQEGGLYRDKQLDAAIAWYL